MKALYLQSTFHPSFCASILTSISHICACVRGRVCAWLGVCVCPCVCIQVIRHPNYNRRLSWRNDVALLKLSSPAQYTDRVSPVCLASSSLSLPSRCVVTGWGRTTSSRE